MSSVQDLMSGLKEWQNSADGRGFALRLDLADLVVFGLREKGWTQKQLAEAAGMKESFITRIIHANSNCTFDVAGRILFALGVDAKLDSKVPFKKSIQPATKSAKSNKSASPRKVA